MLWGGLAILSGLSIIFSLITYQYVVAIINGVVFLGSFFVFLTGLFCAYILAYLLMFYMLACALFEGFYVIVLLKDFFFCASDSCASWRFFIYQTNYIFIVFLFALEILVVKICWNIAVDQRRLEQERYKSIRK